MRGSKVNINFADGPRLKKVLDYAGMPPESQQEIVDCIMDWRDADKDHHLSGAEDDYYESLDPPYKAKNRNLDSVEELLLVKGFKPEYLYGSNDIRPMYDLITTSGDGSININTVSRDVLEMMGTGSDVIDAIFKQRTKRDWRRQTDTCKPCPGPLPDRIL